tara:strand:- start:18759 stop:18995 length:237 start_codon:yes stop_codon:yes gene_type:complete
MILHSFYSDDNLREAQVIRTDFFGEAFKVLCVTYKEPTPKTYKQYVERISTTITQTFTSEQNAEDFAENWVLENWTYQ